ncbi:MAG: HAD-IB family hydrolase [Chitinophagaceae bacterium]
MNRSIAFFDFDGTITRKDTMLELIRFHCGTLKFYTGFIVLAPYLLMMKAGLVTNQFAKEKMLAYFFGGMTLDVFNDVCHQFSKTIIPTLIRPLALDKIRELQETGTEVVLVSASAENWLRDWCVTMNITLLATILEVKDGKITGNLVGLNCHGKEKVVRIQQRYDLKDYTDISCFGDTGGDKPMLALAQHSYYKPFR